MMLELARWSVSELPLFALTAVGTHLVVSGSQTLFHYGLGHHRLGGVFFRNHIRFHHRYYARGHLVSSTYHGDEGNNTPYFLIPTILAATAMFFVLPFDFFLVVSTTRKSRSSRASPGSGTSSSFISSITCTQTAISRS
jgi:hypothetical protein